MTVIKPRLRGSRQHLRASISSIHRRARGSAVSPPQPTAPGSPSPRAAGAPSLPQVPPPKPRTDPAPPPEKPPLPRGPQLRTGAAQGPPQPRRARRKRRGRAQVPPRSAGPAPAGGERGAGPALPRPEPACPARSPPPSSERLSGRGLRVGFARIGSGRGMELELRAFGAARRVRGGHPVPGVGGRADRAGMAALWPEGARGSQPVSAPHRSPHAAAAAPLASPPPPCLGPPARTRPHEPPGARFCPE